MKIIANKVDEKKAKRNLISVWFSMAVILLPFLYQYKGVGNVISFGEIFIGLFSLIAFSTRRMFVIKQCDKYLLIFYFITFIFTILCSVFPYFEFGSAFTVLVRLAFYAVVIYVGRKYFEIQSIWNVYCAFTFVLSFYLLIQYGYHMATGGYLPVYLNYNLQFPPEAITDSLASVYKFNFRASSMFYEPSYFTFYTLPVVCLLIFKNKRTRLEKLTMIVSIIAIALSTASSGIIGLIVIFTYFMFSRSEGRTSHKIALIFIAVLLVIGYLTIFESAASWTIDRLVGGGSINTRITRGIITYGQLPAINKIIGVGVNNLGTYMQKHGISTVYDEGNLNYVSSIIQTLNFSGVIGLVALLNFFGHLYLRIKSKSSQVNGHKMFSYRAPIALCILLFYFSSYEAILFSYRFAYILILIEGVSRLNQQENQRVR